MLGTGSGTQESKEKEKMRKLKQKLARLRRQLKDVNNDVGALGDDPFRLGKAFVEEGDGDSDDECVMCVLASALRLLCLNQRVPLDSFTLLVCGCHYQVPGVLRARQHPVLDRNVHSLGCGSVVDRVPHV